MAGVDRVDILHQFIKVSDLVKEHSCTIHTDDLSLENKTSRY